MTELRRPIAGPCRSAAVGDWLTRAEASLRFVDYRPGPVYDTDDANLAIPVAIRPVAAGSRAVVSYPDLARFSGGDSDFSRLAERSFVYDNALAVIWALGRGDDGLARGLLQTLDALQRPDGSWGFSFSATADGFYNASYIRAGTVAWATYAAARYTSISGDERFVPMLERALAWLLAQVDPASGLVRAGRGRWLDGSHFNPAWDASFSATEHQIDVWFALRAAAADPERNARMGLNAAASRLAEAVDRQLWRPEEGRYAQGDDKGRQDSASALDASGTWAALWDLARGKPGRARQELHWVETTHGRDVLGWPGFVPYVPGAPDTWFVEGGLARALALHRLGDGAQALAALQPTVELACAGGVPLVYSPRWATDFPLSPAAAPTLWFALVARELGGRPGYLWTESVSP